MPSPMMPGRSLLPGRLFVLAMLCALATCRDGTADKAAEGGASEQGASGAAPLGPAPRRPTRRYFLSRTRERCEVYSIDGDAISPPAPAICPPDLQAGERVRLSGKTCVRESPSIPARDVPVVCPDPLLELEAADRSARDAGRE
jgi:hypothetical protein